MSGNNFNLFKKAALKIFENSGEILVPSKATFTDLTTILSKINCVINQHCCKTERGHHLFLKNIKNSTLFQTMKIQQL